MHKFLIYTRKPANEYTDSLANSIHLAYSQNGEPFTPLNMNYGILFPEATISEHDTIREKGVVNPYLFRTKEGAFGIVGIRVAQKGGDDEESRGCIMLWTSKDLIEFDCIGLVRLHNSQYIREAVCEYDPSADVYEIFWRDSGGNIFVNRIKELAAGGSSGPRKAEKFPFAPPQINEIPDIKPGNILEAAPAAAQAAYDHWTLLRHVQTIVPESVKIASPEEMAEVKAEAVYSDGSVHVKKVEWDTSAVDFNTPGTYAVKGKVTTPAYPFPLARGYADPVILPWEGKYYYIATNDNKNDIGLYVRVSDTIGGLFAPGFTETVILDKDEERNFIQTFWAPEFHIIGGDLYILFAVGGKQWAPQCHSMKLKKGGDIMNPADWETPVRTKRKDGSFLAKDGISLDMTYFNADGKSYLVWSYRKGIGTPMDSGSMIYIAETDENDPTTLTSEPVLLTRPLYGWENLQGTINNEGPYPLITKDTVYMVYSGGAARGYTYSIGFMRIPRGGDYLDITQWKKAITPVVNYYSLRETFGAGLYGAGHNSFFTDYDGNTWIAYHAEEKIVGHGECASAMHRVHFKKDGTPVFNLSYERDLDAALSEVSTVVRI